jgi:WD40 repeat protein
MEKPLYEFRGHTGEVLDISWSKDNYLLSASMDKTVRLWKVGSNDCLGVFAHNSYGMLLLLFGF